MKKGIELNTLDVKTNTANSVELNKLDEPDGIKTPSNKENELGNISKPSEDIKETDTERKQKQTKKHVLTYIAGGHWIDSKGDKWAAVPMSGTSITDIREYTDEEYMNRKDLQFMVGYGSMKITTVSL